MHILFEIRSQARLKFQQVYLFDSADLCDKAGEGGSLMEAED
eukprot:SAG22_NODE_474_length_10034_cov_21.356517_3_plen_42_part_00